MWVIYSWFRRVLSEALLNLFICLFRIIHNGIKKYNSLYIQDIDKYYTHSKLGTG